MDIAQAAVICGVAALIWDLAYALFQIWRPSVSSWGPFLLDRGESILHSIGFILCLQIPQLNLVQFWIVLLIFIVLVNQQVMSLKLYATTIRQTRDIVRTVLRRRQPQIMDSYMAACCIFVVLYGFISIWQLGLIWELVGRGPRM